MQTLTGEVISNKLAQTATVIVKRRFMHPIYKKSINITKKFLVHDVKGVKIGDTVRFVPCKPISKKKRWVVTEIVSSKEVVEVLKAENEEVKKIKKNK